VIELTKTEKVRVEIGHSGKYVERTVVVVLGHASYSLSKGSHKLITVRLNAAGLKLLRASKGHAFTSELTVTGTGGVKHKPVSLMRLAPLLLAGE
jgi:hypothetical protein